MVSRISRGCPPKTKKNNPPIVWPMMTFLTSKTDRKNKTVRRMDQKSKRYNSKIIPSAATSTNLVAITRRRQTQRPCDRSLSTGPLRSTIDRRLRTGFLDDGTDLNEWIQLNGLLEHAVERPHMKMHTDSKRRTIWNNRSISGGKRINEWTYFSVSVMVVQDAKGDGRKDAGKVEE